MKSEREQVFVVRFWPVPNAGKERHWRGCVDHLPTGERRYFVELVELNEFVDGLLSSANDEGQAQRSLL